MFDRQINRWWTVVAGALGAAVGAGVVGVYMFGVFAKAIGSEYGWSRSSVSLGLTAFAVASGFGSLTLGLAIDRLGLRRVAVTYVVLFGCSIAAVPLLPARLGLFVAVFSVMGFLGSAATVMPYAVAVCAWFDQQRGLALGLVNAGTGIGAALMPLYAQFLLDRFGWRGGYWGVAAVVTTVAVIALVVLVRLPASYERERRARHLSGATTFGSAIRTSGSFRCISIGIFAISVATFGVISQLVAIGTDRGLTPIVAAGVLSAAGLGSLCARLAIGYAMDRIFAPYVAAGVFLITMLGMGILMGANSLVALTIGAVLIGLGAGAEGDILTFLVSRYFPLSSFGSVTGAIWVMWAWGGALGTYLLALSYDRYHSYNVAIAAFMVLLGIGTVAALRLGPYSFPQERVSADGTSTAEPRTDQLIDPLPR